MNYLSHFVYNHRVCGVPEDPHFVIGVVLPDLWLRFSRTRRIRWRAVRAAAPTEAADVQLRAGLLNHVEVDRRFHYLPEFLRWQQRLKASVAPHETHAALLDFLAHMAIELALDHHLVLEDAELVDHFYDVAERTDALDVAQRVGALAAVNTVGLDEIIRRFLARRFLRHYRTATGLSDVIRIVLALAEIPAPTDGVIETLVAGAIGSSDPATVWHAMRPDP
jgi:hypothetical protein